jgi:hypothetical protein
MDANTLRMLIQAESYDDGGSYDRLALPLAQKAYEVLGDACFQWLLDLALAEESDDKRRNYYLVLASVGYYSDGLSPGFLAKAHSVICDSSAPFLARLSSAHASLRWPRMLYRPDGAYRHMGDIGQLVLSLPELDSLDFSVQSDARYALAHLARREAAFEEVKSHALLIAHDYLQTITSGNSADTSILSAFGLDPRNPGVLMNVITLAMAWGVHSVRQSSDGNEINRLHIRAPESVRFGMFEAYWKRLGDGGRVVKRVGLQSISE